MTDYLVRQRTRADAVAIARLRDHFTVEILHTAATVREPEPRWLAAEARYARRRRGTGNAVTSPVTLTLSPGAPSQRVVPRYLQEAAS